MISEFYEAYRNRHNLAKKWKREGKKIFGMGAPVKGNTLLNYFGIGKQFLDCLVEKNELRRGLFSPGTHLPILIEKEIQPPDGVCRLVESLVNQKNALLTELSMVKEQMNLLFIERNELQEKLALPSDLKEDE